MARTDELLIRARVRGAGSAVKEFDADARKLQDSMVREFRNVSAEVEQAFREAAPEGSGRLRAGIRSAAYFNNPSAPQVSVYARVRNPDDGFDYFEVTRYGHEKLYIVPIRKRALDIGGLAVRASADAYRPDHDWVETGYDAATKVIDKAESRLGRSIIVL